MQAQSSGRKSEHKLLVPDVTLSTYIHVGKAQRAGNGIPFSSVVKLPLLLTPLTYIPVGNAALAFSATAPALLYLRPSMG